MPMDRICLRGRRAYLAIREIITSSFKIRLIHDFEDGMEYYSAIQHNCDCIITENQQDFYFSKIEVIGCEEFMVKLQHN
jgi:hypothetical protein